MTTVAYFNHLGGPSPDLTQLMTSIWIEAHVMGITLTARHFGGAINLQADRLSRLSTMYEWQLHPRVFQYPERVWGPHHVDKFATTTNAQLPGYNSFQATILHMLRIRYSICRMVACC